MPFINHYPATKDSPEELRIMGLALNKEFILGALLFAAFTGYKQDRTNNKK